MHVPHHKIGVGEFRHAPDQEVQWWHDRLLHVPYDRIVEALEEVPMYSQYIQQSDMSEIVRDMFIG